MRAFLNYSKYVHLVLVLLASNVYERQRGDPGHRCDLGSLVVTWFLVVTWSPVDIVGFFLTQNMKKNN